jgi:hypothetical protein
VLHERWHKRGDRDVFARHELKGVFGTGIVCHDGGAASVQSKCDLSAAAIREILATPRPV